MQINLLPKSELEKYTTVGQMILAYCNHEDDPYFLIDENGNLTGRLTTYGSHAEGLSRVDDGYHVLVFGGEYYEYEYGSTNSYIPNWWFQNGSDFEIVANPVKFVPLEI